MTRSRSLIVAFLLLAGSHAAAGEPQSTVVIRVDGATSGELVLRSAVDSTSEMRQPVIAGAASFTAAAESTWDATIDKVGWWSPPERVTFPKSGEDQKHIHVWKTAKVTGQIALADKTAAMPEKFRIFVEEPPRRPTAGSVPRGSRFDCAVDRDRWSCSLPVATMDLALRSEGFVPEYRWNVKVSDETPNPLGTFTLKRGGSLLAWLSAESMKALDGKASGRLVRMLPPDPSPTAARLSVPIAESTFNQRGAIQLAPVPAGKYILVVDAKGFAPARVSPVEVFDGKESSFRREIVLERPLTLRFTLTPEKDPFGDRWRGELMRGSDFSSGYEESPAEPVVASDGGVVELADHAPGTYYLALKDTHGNRWLTSEIHVHDAVDASQNIKIPVLQVRGTVRLGDAPIATGLWFGGRFGGSSIHLTSANDGKFEGWLPRSGRWLVEIQSDDGAVRTVSEVTVDDDDESVEIRLPSRGVSGWVVNATGERVPNADVQLITGRNTVFATTGADGAFSFRGLPNGDIHITARSRTGDSAPEVPLQLADDEQRDGVELHLQGRSTLRGRIVSRGAAVAGARIAISALGIGIAPRIGTVSNGDGTFEAKIPERARQVAITVAAPARTLQMFSAAVDGSPVVLELEPVGGTLTIESKAITSLRLKQNGLNLSMSDVGFWLGAQGERSADGEILRVPNLAPAAYEACVAIDNQPRCSAGTLPAGGSLTLRLTADP